MPASQESPAGTAPSVVLVEEYDALSAALTSALKKFAPRHRVHVVETLSEAEAKAAEAAPQLFIVDFDPPRSDAIDFLGRLAAAHPSARFLAIASGVPAVMKTERTGPNALQFIDKPFDLAEFGAAVQALLGPWTNVSSGDSRGTLRDVNLRDFIPLQCLNMATAVLHLRSADDRAGEIHFVDGHLTHAATGNFTGAGALFQMMRWRTPRAHETEGLVDGPRSLHGPWVHVFVEALRQTKDLPLESPPAPAPLPAPPPIEAPEPPKPAQPVPKTGKKIVIVDDTEMLLIFVEDSLATADPSLQIVTAFTGSEGVRRAQVAVPDLVLLDYSLPDVLGDEVCQRLLENEKTARVPVVMMSGHVAEMAATARKYRNVVATIAKPFMSEALVAIVKETLAKGPLPVRPPEPAEIPPPRRGNGKKPVKKNGATAALEIPPKPATPPSPPLPAPTSPALQIPSAPVPVHAVPLPPAAPATVAPPPAAPAPAPQIEVAPAPVAWAEPPPTKTEVAPPVPQFPVAIAPPAIPPPPPPVPVAPPPAPPPPVAVAPRPLQRPIIPPAPSALAASNGSTVVLGLGMEVVAVQFTPRMQVGLIRARPTASTLSLSHSAKPTENLLSGFEIGSVELDQHGRIEAIRVVPTRQPANTIRPRNEFQINQVALLNQNSSIELSAGHMTPMTIQLAALFKIAGVELSDRFEVAQLVLRPAHHRVRVSIDP